MDLTRSAGDASSLPAAQDPGVLVRALGEASERLGFALPARILPGGIPAIDVAPEHLVETCRFLRDQMSFDLLSSVSGVDMLDGRFDVVYHLRSMQRGWLMQVKVRAAGDPPEVESVISVWPTANWLERETFDLFGIVFTGHPDLRRILLDDEFEGYPLRKSFRPTPLTVHDRATTEAPPDRALSGESERGVGPQRVVSNLLSQGEQERLHPGTPTFGHTQFHGREFPPTTWKHTLERAAEEQKDEEKK
jgi:NADH/F420H2 dehydrogenase subunit C